MREKVKGVGIKVFFKMFWEPDNNGENPKNLEKFDIDQETAKEIANLERKIEQLKEKYAVNVGKTEIKKKNTIEKGKEVKFKNKAKTTQKNKDDDLIR